VNDLLVTALVLAVSRWNAGLCAQESPDGRVPSGGRGRIAIAVPVNIRDAGHRWTGPGNQSRLIRVSARPADCECPGKLLALVSAQVRAARECPRPGLDGASRLLAAGWAPAALKRVAVRLARRLAAPFTTDTALVSNLGQLPAPPSFGSPRETGSPLWFAGPAPMPRGLGLGALTADGRLHLTVVYSRALFDAAAAADFSAAYRRAFGELSGPAASPETGPGKGPRSAVPERETT
jgi:hypothetical protein